MKGNKAIVVQESEAMQEVALCDDKMVSVDNLKVQVSHIQKVMKSLMKEDVHYGVIFGTKKPSLWKPGAELLQLTFGITTEVEMEDKSTPDDVAYRVKATAIHRKNGVVLGTAYGEASSNEDKYKWKASICDEQFEQTPENRRRVKFGKGKAGAIYKVKQIRTEPADIANTILKMAEKRAVIGITLRVTSASGVFDQSEHDSEGSGGSDNAQQQSHPKEVSQPKPQYQQAPSAPPLESPPDEAFEGPAVSSGCEGCSVKISEKVTSFSMSRFGKALCMDCQKLEPTNG